MRRGPSSRGTSLTRRATSGLVRPPNTKRSWPSPPSHDLPDDGKVFAGQRREGFYVDLGSILDLADLRPFQHLDLIPTPDAPGVNATKNQHLFIWRKPDKLAGMTDLLRALGDSTRRQILTSLQARRETVTVDEVAAAQGIHRTVAFEHLELLARLGLLVRGSRAGFRGRPARTYRFGGEAAEVSYPPRQHRLLAGLLAEAIAGGAEPKRVGEASGRQLALGSRTESEAIACLEPLGAGYELSGRLIQARNCVFQEACVSARGVVCGVQAGLLQGALAAAGLIRDVVPGGPDGAGGCSFEVR